MTHSNDNESNQLAFPIQLNNEIDPNQTDDSLAAEMRVRIARAVNMVNVGEDTMDEELAAWINRVNALLVRGNYEPVPVDFTTFGVTKNSDLCLINLTIT